MFCNSCKAEGRSVQEYICEFTEFAPHMTHSFESLTCYKESTLGP